MIYDCFCFFNELELLEIRLNTLNDVVDYFVICESSVTHTGKAKPFHYEENKHKFADFHHKIIHVKVEDTPNDFINLPDSDDPIYGFIVAQDGRRFNRATEIHYGRDFFQKEACRRGLVNCKDDDVIIFSDCDEIPNPEILKDLNATVLNAIGILVLKQPMYYYYVDWLRDSHWMGSRIATYRLVKGNSLNELRAYNQGYVPNGGWHFSYLGGPDRVRQKLEAFSAQELVNETVLRTVGERMAEKKDLFLRGPERIAKVGIDGHPKYLLENKHKFAHLFSDYSSM